MSKPYTKTTAVRDALDLALGATNMAHEFAQQAGLPVVRRLEVLLVELTEIEKDVQHVERQAASEPNTSQVSPGQGLPSIPPHIASMLVNLHPMEKMALDAAVRNGSLDPSSQNDRRACESLFKKGVFEFDPQNRFVIAPAYAPFAARHETPHEILAKLPVHLRELLRVIAAKGGKVRTVPDGQRERDYNDLLGRAILVTDGAFDQLRIADPFKDIAA